MNYLLNTNWLQIIFWGWNSKGVVEWKIDWDIHIIHVWRFSFYFHNEEYA